MRSEFGDLGPRFDIPEHAGLISGTRDDLPIVDEAAAREETAVGIQFATDSNLLGIVGRSEGIDGADVVKSSARDESS